MKDSWNPEQYEKFKNERSQPFFDLMAMVERKNIENAVDLGCGSGELTKLLFDSLSVKHGVGIDSSESMLEKALAFSGPNLTFKRRDIELFRESAKYDLIYSNAALQWCSSHGQILENLRESLAPNGQLAIQMPMNHDYPSHVVASEVASREPYAAALKLSEGGFKDKAILKPEAYASLLYGLGFKRQRVYMNVYSHILESRESVIEWVKGTMLTYYQSNLPPELFVDFMQEYKEELFQVLPDERPFFYPFKRLMMWASLSDS
jgi:trans-aconitate 2-methyltransferase